MLEREPDGVRKDPSFHPDAGLKQWSAGKRDIRQKTDDEPANIAEENCKFSPHL